MAEPVAGAELPNGHAAIATPGYDLEYLGRLAEQSDDPGYLLHLAEHGLTSSGSAFWAWTATRDPPYRITEFDDPDGCLADQPEEEAAYHAYLAEHGRTSCGSAYRAWTEAQEAEWAKEDAEQARAAARKAKRLADGEWWADGQAVLDYFAPPGWTDYVRAAEPKGKPKGARFMGRTPSEDANLPPLTYFDDHRALSIMPRVPDGAALIVTGKRSSHKTGVVLKECVDAALKGARILYLAYEGAHGIRTKRLPAICRQRGITLEALDDRWVTLSVGPNILQEKELDELIGSYDLFKPDIVVLDTMTRAVAGADINAPAVGTGIITGMEYLAQGFGGALVIGVNHPGKDAARGGIGSSLIESLAYAIWRVSLKDEVVTLLVDKMKDGPAEFKLTLRVTKSEGGVPVIVEIPAEERAAAAKASEAEAARLDQAQVLKAQVIAAVKRLHEAGKDGVSIGDVANELAKGAEADDSLNSFESIKGKIYRGVRERKGGPAPFADLLVLDPTGMPLTRVC